MSGAPTLSLIIPSLNEESRISHTIHTWSPAKITHEVIVCDGGSADRTVPQATQANARVVHCKKGICSTIAAGKNAGAGGAGGDFFVFCDADTSVRNADEFFRHALARFDTDSKLVALTGALRVLPEYATVADNIVFACMNGIHWLLNNLVPWGAAPGEFQMVRAEAFRRVGGFNETLVASEDYDLFRRLRNVGRTRYDNALVVYHTGRRAHETGWLPLLWSWWKNFISVLVWKRASSDRWTPVR
jgi:cellulose synthase/poly-beta-1,6-N-acetylglucosamine synthase-like glycosyltransferase